MFSSATASSINHFANFSSSYHHFPSLFSGYDNSVLLNYQHDPLTGVLLPANPRIAESFTYMPHSENATTSKQDIDSLNADYDGPSSFLASYKRPSTARKDRHSKICTAQGLRDRRVRLSIEIAREFFDLQDMLGFDKASKTLEWLLIKSRNAIKELARLKHTGNEGLGARWLYPTSECEMVSGSGKLEGTVSKSKALVGISEEKKTEKPHKDAFQHLAKESRDKARARARQRTKEKMCTRRLHEWKKGSDTSTQILTQLRSFSQFKACEASTSYGHNIAFSLKAAAHGVEEPCYHALADLASRADVIEDSIVLKRKLNSSTISPCQQNLGISEDASCNSSSYHQNLTQNLDINSAIPHSTFRAVSNMNLSGGLQLYGKTWEARNGQCQH